MTVLAITGIGGFVGIHLAERAIDLGWTVRGIEYNLRRATRARQLGADVVVGDINNPADLRTALQGADVVVHAAAKVNESGKRSLFERVNIDGTRAVCSMAQQLGISCLIHISSSSVYGFKHPASLVTEETPVNSENNIYCDSLIAAERIALSFNAPPQLGVILLRPSSIYGVGSLHWITRPMQWIHRGLFVLPKGGKGIIDHLYIDNFLDALFLAIEKKPYGEIFNISDDIGTPSHLFFKHHAQMAGRAMLPQMPVFILRIFLRAFSSVYHSSSNDRQPVHLSVLKFLGREHRISIEKARRILGYNPQISLDQGMRHIKKKLLKLPTS